MKLKCACGKLAEWMLMSGENDHVACDACVPRGCSCMEIEPDDWDWKNTEKDHREWRQELDYLGRKQPCIEWSYDEKGWDDEKD